MSKSKKKKSAKKAARLQFQQIIEFACNLNLEKKITEKVILREVTSKLSCN